MNRYDEYILEEYKKGYFHGTNILDYQNNNKTLSYYNGYSDAVSSMLEEELKKLSEENNE